MKTTARVVVIGGGIAGASVLYHLARLGWSDCVLVEQGELSDGSTWHSAGHCILPYVSRRMTRFTKESIALYRSLEAETGNSSGFLETGSLTLATTPDRVDELKRLAGTAKVESVPFELISAAAAQELWPFAKLDDVLIAGYSPGAGRVDPSSTTAALVAGARMRGAEAYRRTRVVKTQQMPSGDWSVETTKGSIVCEYVVNATGQWARELARPAGIELPLVPLEHQYVVTAPLAALTDHKSLPILRSPDSGFYMRPEGVGLLVGMYEEDARTWAVDGIPASFLHSLLPADLERVADPLSRAESRVPMLADAGIRTVVNGPDAYTPDDRFLAGAVPGSRTYFVFAGFNSAGVQTAGAAARYLAEWIVDGEPSIDLSEFDVRRFRPHAQSTAYIIAGAIETYRKHYPVRYPVEERQSCRCLRTSPLYDVLAARGAVYGERFGWERPVWFATRGTHAFDEPSFRHPNWFGPVARECEAVRDKVGVTDQTSLAKIFVRGPGAAGLLDGLVATALPGPGRTSYALMLSDRGGIETDLTITRWGQDCFYLVCAAADEIRTSERLLEQAHGDRSVEVETVTTRFGVLTVAGPRSRELLQRVSGRTMNSAEFPFLSNRELPIGSSSARALRVAYSGELGWELHLPIEALRYAYVTLLSAGEELGLADVGYRALESFGLETRHGLVGADLGAEYTPLEAGLRRFVSLDKGPFRGREAVERQLAEGAPQHRACLVFPEDDDTVPCGLEPVAKDGEVVSYVAWGGYGHRIHRSIAYAYLRPAVIADPTGLVVEVLGEPHPVVVSPKAPYYRKEAYS